MRAGIKRRSGIDPARRRLLGAALALVAPWQVGASALRPSRWVAAWNEGTGYRIGLLRLDTQGWQVENSLPVPTRAHGLLVLHDGSVIAVARRPGDWVLRWQPRAGDRKPQVVQRWAEPQRQFNGHALLHPDGRHLWLSETDTEADTGLIVLRDLTRLAMVAEWPTQGRDPHQMLLSPDGQRLWVANGGIASRAETGRARLAAAPPMDASLAELDARTGQLRQRWPLSDPHLSLRHLAWHPASKATEATLGVALQAEHADPATKQAAPVLALLQPYAADAVLRTAEPHAPMAGYAGDICATPAGFAVSSPRGDRIACWSQEGQWQSAIPLRQACALSRMDESRGDLVAAGQALGAVIPTESTVTAQQDPLPVTPDNHWVRWM